MRQLHEQMSPNALPRTSSCKSTSKIIPANFTRSATTSSQYPPAHHLRRGIATFLRSLISIFTFPSIILPTCRRLSIPASPFSLSPPSLGRKVTGTLLFELAAEFIEQESFNQLQSWEFSFFFCFGHRRGHVSFAFQDDPRSDPVVVIELAVSTTTLVKEMSSGLVRIALECEKAGGGTRAAQPRLYGEPAWTMYCNGRKCGYAASRVCTDSDRHVLRMVQSVSVGAGMIPVVDGGGKGGSAAEGELVYMRARFERVVGSRDSEAFYMLNPDGNGGPELSIFLLRI
ncbi:hypothetical protein CASFOL_019524 [Castilleja foliolosa]|uniref:Protein MIZU-KUSSEI 1 n=1 Tax=Castilleja foliolosa TaxID=1961234 RepID=A0ABD3D8I9_9LAMI